MKTQKGPLPSNWTGAFLSFVVCLCFNQQSLNNGSPGFLNGLVGLILVADRSFDHVVEVPCALIAQVGEAVDVTHVVIDVSLIADALSHAVHDSYDFSTGDLVVASECTVVVTGDPALLSSSHNCVVEPVGGGYIGELASGQVVLDAQEPNCHSSKLSTGDGGVRIELAVALTVDDASGSQSVHSGSEPILGADILEVDASLAHILVHKQVVEHLGGFGAGHVVVGLNSTVGIAIDVRDVVLISDQNVDNLQLIHNLDVSLGAGHLEGIGTIAVLCYGNVLTVLIGNSHIRHLVGIVGLRIDSDSLALLSGALVGSGVTAVVLIDIDRIDRGDSAASATARGLPVGVDSDGGIVISQRLDGDLRAAILLSEPAEEAVSAIKLILHQRQTKNPPTVVCGELR